jgi:hypothetical protein
VVQQSGRAVMQVVFGLKETINGENDEKEKINGEQLD